MDKQKNNQNVILKYKNIETKNYIKNNNLKIFHKKLIYIQKNKFIYLFSFDLNSFILKFFLLFLKK
jgi:hypothetical protein